MCKPNRTLYSHLCLYTRSILHQIILLSYYLIKIIWLFILLISNKYFSRNPNYIICLHLPLFALIPRVSLSLVDRLECIRLNHASLCFALIPRVSLLILKLISFFCRELSNNQIHKLPEKIFVSNNRLGKMWVIITRVCLLV